MLEAYRKRFHSSFESHRAYFDDLDRDSQTELQNILVCLDKYEDLLTEPLFVRLIDALESYHFAEFLTALSSTERFKGRVDSGDVERFLDTDRLTAAIIALDILEKADMRFGLAEFAVKLEQLIAVYANPVINMIYQKRDTGYSDDSVRKEPITAAVAHDLIAKATSDDTIERRVSEAFDVLNRFREENLNLLAMTHDMYYSPEALAQDAVQDFFIAQLNDPGVLLATTQAGLQKLTREGASHILPLAEQHRLAADIEQNDSYSMRSYKKMMTNVEELLSTIRAVDVSEALAERMAREPAVVPPGMAATVARFGVCAEVPETAGTGAGDHMCDAPRPRA